MNLQEPSIDLRLQKEKSAALKAFLNKQKACSELASSLLEQISQNEEEIKDFKLTLCVELDIEQALDLEVMLKKEVPTAKGGWTPLHSIRMNLLESLAAYFRHVSIETKEALLEHRKDSAFF